MKDQQTFFDNNIFHIDKPIRLITLFSGYDSQALALKYLGVPFEHYRTCEWAVKSIQALRDLHFNSDTVDYAKDLTQAELVQWLADKGISMDYKKPMTKEQISRKPLTWLKTVYNNIKASRNMVNIQQVHGEDLGITDTDKYCYLMTYSYPCQSLSAAGKQEGFTEGSGTTSSMLWEIKRIFNELIAGQHLPTVLVMENVPQVHGTKFVGDFNKWIDFLDGLGYVSYWKDLNAKDYKIPQNRDRCFMVSILGKDNYYEFPKRLPLKLRLKNVLETNVPEGYYLSAESILRIGKWKAHQKPLEHILNDKSITPCLTARGGGRTQWDVALSRINTLVVTPPHGYFGGKIENRETFPTIDTGTATRWHNVLMEISNGNENI